MSIRFPAKESIVSIIFLFTVSILLYAPSLKFDLAYDDYLHLRYDPVVNGKEGPPTLSSIFRHPTYPGDLYRPLVTASYVVNQVLLGKAPFGFHLINLILYGAVVSLVFWFCYEIFQDRKSAFLCALLFLVHPLHVEVVANISGRTELLAAFFGLLCLISSVGEKKKSHVQIGIFSGLTFGLALLSKESAILLVPVILTALFLFRERHEGRFLSKRNIILALSLTLVTSCYLLVRFAVLHDSFLVRGEEGLYHPENPLLGVPLQYRVFPGVVLLGRYIQSFFLPLSLQIDYSEPLFVFWDKIYSASGILSVVCAILFSVWIAKGRTRERFFGCFALLALLIALNIVVPIGTIRGNRLTFFSTIGFAAFLYGELWTRLPRALFLSLTLVFITVWTVITWSRIPYWWNNETVFLRAFEENPKSTKVALSLGMHYLYREKDRERAEYYFRASHEIDPSVTQSSRYLLDFMLERKDIGRAEYWAREILRFSPEDENVREKLRRIIEVREGLQGRS